MFSAQRLWQGIPQLVTLFFSRMVPPEWPAAETLWQASLETLHTAVAGTFLGALFAYPLGVLAASNWTPTWVHLPTKAVLALIRSFHPLLLALLFIAPFGLGPFPGMLAIAVHSIGVLGRFVAVGVRWLASIQAVAWVPENLQPRRAEIVHQLSAKITRCNHRVIAGFQDQCHAFIFRQLHRWRE